MRNKFLNLRMLIIITLSLQVMALLYTKYYSRKAIPPIRIGILHSLSGTMLESEKPLVDILLMAVDEMNSKGGLLGHKIETVVIDSRSSHANLASKTEKLILEEGVDVIFGCWTSACRKAVKPIVEKYNHLLFYPVQYEGLEQSDSIIYTGAAPNQQIVPGTIWALENLGSRLYLVGSDYIFPRTANLIINDISKVKNSTVLAERYIPLGSDNFDETIKEIKALQPDVIINTVNGDSNHHFFQKKHDAGLDNIPVMSFSITEIELADMPYAKMDSHYATWTYFQGINSSINDIFINKIRLRMGPDQMVGDPMEATYSGFQLWAQTVRKTGSAAPHIVKKGMNEQTLRSPSGIISVDGTNHHLRKIVRVGQTRHDGQFDIVWQSEYAIRPVPYLTYRSRSEWQDLINKKSRSGK